MRIINTTDIAKGTGVKVIGIGEYRVMPGESIDIPDEIAYINDCGKKVILPAIAALVRTHQIRCEEAVTSQAPAPAPDADSQPSDGAPAGEGEDGDKEPELTDEEKKAAAAKKRAEARAAKKAAEEAAKASGAAE